MAARFAFESCLPTSVGVFDFQANRIRHVESGYDSINQRFPNKNYSAEIGHGIE